MEKTSINTDQLLNLIVVLIQVLLPNIFCLYWVSINQFLSSYWSVFPFQPHCCDSKHKDEKDSEIEFVSEDSCVNEKKDAGNLCREEVEILMKKLGIFCSPESEELPQCFASDELSGLFEEKEPSLEEVKEAFDVFDENKDGFIDARELQRVLCILGLKEGSELENCQRMIKTFDENQDDRIDFNEFVKFMERSF